MSDENIQWCYSLNGENYNGDYSNKDDAIEQARADADGEEIIYIAKAKKPAIESYFDLDITIERMEEELYDNELSSCDDDDLIEIDDSKKLESEIRELIKEHCSTRHYTVYDVEEIAVN